MLTGIILAGGRNSRMNGRNKALLIYEGEHFIERQINVMRSICTRLIIVTNDASYYKKWAKDDLIYIPDIYEGHGPLSGFHAAFVQLETEYAWVVGCDYPKLSASAALWMLSQLKTSDYDAVLPVVDGKHQMLHGVYRPHRMLPSIIQRLESHQYRLSGLLDSIHWLGLGESDWIEAGIAYHFIEDVDTPEQYIALLQEREGGSDHVS
ncbi:molybdenum cofactor guanylyltransferase [Paenibacillus terrigena]|uniref:molybdenum cofactor guanylyltransferase n=1 Tax=Paenibacillus terrigena TaxID=369333 RepID=UPI0028D34B30|nr:molybdenum cofactor guanylyltransferase [Paenibacillus terrigena]